MESVSDYSPEPLHLGRWLAGRGPGAHAIFDSEFTFHAHVGPCDVGAAALAPASATEVYVHQLHGASVLMSPQEGLAAARPPRALGAGDVCLLETGAGDVSGVAPGGASLGVEAGGVALVVSNRVAVANGAQQ